MTSVDTDTDTVSVDLDTIASALAVGLHSAEAGRRVGWARAYEALARIDALSEDLRQTRDELKWLRRAYSRLLGFAFISMTPSATKTAVWQDEIGRHLKAEETFRHDDAWNAGVARAWQHRAIRAGWSEEELAAQKERLRRPPPARCDRPPEGITKKKKDAWFAEKRDRWQLFQDSAALGHKFDSDWAVDAEGLVEATCSCGDTSGPTSRFDAVGWKRNHVAWTVHGMSYAEWISSRIPLRDTT